MFEEDLDSEWEDFDRLVADYNTKKRKVLASPIFQRRHVDDLREPGLETKHHPQQTAFYPCPPIGVKDDDCFSFEDTSVSFSL